MSRYEIKESEMQEMIDKRRNIGSTMITNGENKIVEEDREENKVVTKPKKVRSVRVKAKPEITEDYVLIEPVIKSNVEKTLLTGIALKLIDEANTTTNNTIYKDLTIEIYKTVNSFLLVIDHSTYYYFRALEYLIEELNNIFLLKRDLFEIHRKAELKSFIQYIGEIDSALIGIMVKNKSLLKNLLN